MVQTPPGSITIVTPCWNAESYISDTMRSILDAHENANHDMTLQYIICDGGSTDNTLKIIENIVAEKKGVNVDFEIISEKDHGMYHALAKGLQAASGDIVSYLNAGDLYSPQAFDIIFTIFATMPVRWLTGMTVLYNEFNHVIGAWLPFKYRRQLIQCGFYDGRLPFIQQETTFWRKDLLALVDLQKLASLQFAGDFYLWKKFSEQTDLFITEAWLGGWKIHQGQISADLQSYKKEMHLLAKRPTFSNYLTYIFDRLPFLLPNDLKKRLNRKTLIRFDLKQQRYTL